MTVNVRTLADITKAPAGADSPLATQEYFINMGPQHPATHGVLRIVTKLDGETVRGIYPVLGYVHRGIEKIGEHENYRQFVHLSDRLDYLSALSNNWVVSKTVEKAAEIEVTERAEYIRTIVCELQRIESHLLLWGVFGMDLGALTAFLYGFRDREYAADILEETTGCRLTMNYILPGGVMTDIHPNFVKRTKDYLKYLKPKIQEFEELVSGNVIVQARLKGIGVLSKEQATSFGVTGPVIRASGIPLDLRKAEPYGVYDKVDFDVAVGEAGDSWDRYYVRLHEIRESMKIIEQLIDNIPEGKHMTLKPAAKIKPPAGNYYSQIETPRGIVGCYIVAEEKSEIPYRIHMRTPCFNNLWCMTEIAKDWRIADLVAIMSSLDVVIPDIDR